MIKTVGSICSGIEAASVAWNPLGLSFQWFSEIAPFPSRVLKEKFPNVPNLGEMNNIPLPIEQGKITAPDLICGGMDTMPKIQNVPLLEKVDGRQAYRICIFFIGNWKIIFRMCLIL